VMNYRFGDAMFRFFIDDQQQIKASQLDALLQKIRSDYPPEKAYLLQNCLDSHDMERLASAVVNPDRWMDHANNLQYNREFDVRKPNTAERTIQKTILAFQFTYPGAPYIYYGDEVGMWGADDPDCRKPMVWEEFTYEPEKTHPCDYLPDCDYTRPADSVAVDKNLFLYYQNLIKLRNTYRSLNRGNYRTILVDNEKGIFAFERQLGNETIRAVFNGSKEDHPFPKSILENNINQWRPLLTPNVPDTLHAKSAQIFINR